MDIGKEGETIIVEPVPAKAPEEVPVPSPAPVPEPEEVPA